MRIRCVKVIILLVLLTAPLSASVDDGPVDTILWNRITALTVVEDYLIGVSTDGIIVASYVDSLYSYDVIAHNPLSFVPVDIRTNDRYLLVETDDFRIVCYDINSLPDIQYSHTIDPGVQFADYILRGNDLYLTSWFEGLYRFAVDLDGSVNFVDSSMIGILLSQLDEQNDTLYVLDEFNGIMRYDLGGTGVGMFIDYLNVPQEVGSFMRNDTTVLLALKSSALLIGEFGHSGSGIIDSLEESIQVDRFFSTDELIVLVSPRKIMLLNKSDYLLNSIVAIEMQGKAGAITLLNDEQQLILPTMTGGATLFSMTSPGVSRPGLYRSGPIEELHMNDGYLYTGGLANPIDVFAFDSTLTPKRSHTLYEALREVRSIEQVGDSLLVFFKQINKVMFFTNPQDPDSFIVERSFLLQDSSANEVEWLEHRFDTLQAILAKGRHTLQLYTVSDSGEITPQPVWEFIGGITSVVSKDLMLFVATGKNQLWSMRIDSNFELELLSVSNLDNRAESMIWVNDRLIAFVGTAMYIYQIDSTFNPVFDSSVLLPLTVLDISEANDSLYAIGPEGIAVFDLSGSSPELTSFGGEGGDIIAVERNVMVASDGGSIRVYKLDVDVDDPDDTVEQPPIPTDFRLSQNYPNPFNGTTTIDYDLAIDAHVELTIYNALGQKVRKLVDMRRSAGAYRVEWDGTNATGRSVASGVYLYEFRAGDERTSRKMLYVK